MLFLSKCFESLYCCVKKVQLKIIYGKRIVIGKNVKFRKGFLVNISKNGFLEIGTGVFFNRNCHINCHSKIIIGNNNIFGENVLLYDHNHIFNKKTFNKKELNIGNIIIGDENWFCSNVVVCNNAKVGNRCVISACTCYTNKTQEDFRLYKQNGTSSEIMRS